MNELLSFPLYHFTKHISGCNFILDILLLLQQPVHITLILHQNTALNHSRCCRGCWTSSGDVAGKRLVDGAIIHGSKATDHRSTEQITPWSIVIKHLFTRSVFMVLFINDSMFSICEQLHLACQLTCDLLNKGF